MIAPARLLMLDLFSGVGGASNVMRAKGWDVVRVEIEPDLDAEFRDVRAFSWRGGRPDLIWASPPCTEFSLACAGRVRTIAPPPSIDLVLHAQRIIRECSPRFWIIENVAGACRYFEPILGPHRQSIGPFFLWGNFPLLPVDPWPIKGYKGRKKSGRFHDREKDRRHRARARAEIPAEISEAVADMVECVMDLPLELPRQLGAPAPADVGRPGLVNTFISAH